MVARNHIVEIYKTTNYNYQSFHIEYMQVYALWVMTRFGLSNDLMKTPSHRLCHNSDQRVVAKS